ncbi:MAG TPA: phosphoadenylyl-sulfate reductase [Porticoccaceae bacterium]|nr:phosphoadenylyl-sulfate reductase [Porticoccaceae bacterium]HIG67911.1 phosphoadenylyl-sulfate reductase [Porticoccaceae bacterium]HIK80144.1 phosphoadenylyl-sulfate reductase [Porticoccaceae bacterium]
MDSNQSWLTNVNEGLEKKTALERIEFAAENLPGNYSLASSFGAQSAVSLHMITQVIPKIPVILIDTGYLFPETYQFVDQLVEALDLEMHVYQSTMSPAWQEARYGKLWEKDTRALNEYNQRNKVEPMDRALNELEVGTWFAGLRREQSKSRHELPIIQTFKDRVKVHPIIDWSNRDIHQYLQKHRLPYNPLWEKGYVSIGDKHSTKPLTLGLSEEDTRFGGTQRECGLHVDTLGGL